MANRRFTQFFYTPHAMPVLIDCNFVVGAAGAVGTLKGPGVESVNLLADGLYQVKLQDNYHRFYGAFAGAVAPVTGANITAGSFVIGTPYVITAVGTTDWAAVGLPKGLTPTPGQSFVATAAGSGTGTVKAVSTSGVASIEVVGNANLMLYPKDASGNIGGYIMFQCLDSAGDAVNPTEGSVLSFAMYLSNSSVQTKGE